MPRSGRGGPRQGTPGKSYSNRTDLGQDYAPTAGGAPAPATAGPPPVDFSSAPGMSPDELPNLLDPTTRPSEPGTHGAAMGPGGGPEVLNLPSAETDARNLMKYLPVLQAAADRPDSSVSLRTVVTYLRSL